MGTNDDVDAWEEEVKFHVEDVPGEEEFQWDEEVVAGWIDGVQRRRMELFGRCGSYTGVVGGMAIPTDIKYVGGGGYREPKKVMHVQEYPHRGLGTHGGAGQGHY